MKKAITLNSILSLLAVVVTLTFSTCKKESSGVATGIVGKWATYAWGTREVIAQYEFKSNDSVEFYQFKIDTVTKNIIGYQGKSSGKYKVENSVLTMYNLDTYSNPSGDFVPVSQLIKTNSSSIVTYTIGFNAQKNQLLFYFVCPPNANCLPSPIVYHRE